MKKRLFVLLVLVVSLVSFCLIPSWARAQSESLPIVNNKIEDIPLPPGQGWIQRGAKIIMHLSADENIYLLEKKWSCPEKNIENFRMGYLVNLGQGKEYRLYASFSQWNKSSIQFYSILFLDNDKYYRGKSREGPVLVHGKPNLPISVNFKPGKRVIFSLGKNKREFPLVFNGYNKKEGWVKASERYLSKERYVLEETYKRQSSMATIETKVYYFIEPGNKHKVGTYSFVIWPEWHSTFSKKALILNEKGEFYATLDIREKLNFDVRPDHIIFTLGDKHKRVISLK